MTLLRTFPKSFRRAVVRLADPRSVESPEGAVAASGPRRAGRRAASSAALVLASGLVLAACGGGTESGAGASDGGEDQAVEDPSRTEVGSLTPRIVLATDTGVVTLDSADGSVVDESDVEGYARLNPAGDGRHVMISAADGFTAYDTGLEAQAHGDHFHYYQQDPQLTDITIDAPHPGHVVPHGENTATFADGTGQITIFDPAVLADGELGETTDLTTDDPHHGVAVPLEGGQVLLTQGTEEDRDTVQVIDADGRVVAETDDCPGVHGEAAAEGDTVSLGCENGPVVYRDGEFHKVDVEEDFQRSGNQKGHPGSPVILADYKVEEDPEGGIERPTEIGLVDTRDDSITKVDLGSEYWFRSLDRGPDGEALVLTADGELNILDPESGKAIHEVKDVVQPWEEPEEWQTPGPMLSVADGTAFVADPDNQTLKMVDIDSGEIYDEVELDVTPHEIQVTTGTASGEYDVSGGSEGEDHESEGEDHEGHDHDHDGEGHDHGEDGHDHGDDE